LSGSTNLTKKRWTGGIYQELLKDINVITLPTPEKVFADNIYWVFPIILKDNYHKDAEQVMKELADNKIGTRPFFYPMHKQPVFIKMGLFIGESYP